VGRESPDAIANRIREGTRLPPDTKFLLLQHNFREMIKPYWDRAQALQAGIGNEQELKRAVRQELDWMTDDAHETFWRILTTWAWR
jgi:hypothetical protein